MLAKLHAVLVAGRNLTSPVPTFVSQRDAVLLVHMGCMLSCCCTVTYGLLSCCCTVTYGLLSCSCTVIYGLLSCCCTVCTHGLLSGCCTVIYGLMSCCCTVYSYIRAVAMLLYSYVRFDLHRSTLMANFLCTSHFALLAIH